MRFNYSISGRHIVLFIVLGMIGSELVLRSTGFYCVVQGSSMYPTFKPNDVVQTKSSKASPERGDGCEGQRCAALHRIGYPTLFAG